MASADLIMSLHKAFHQLQPLAKNLAPFEQAHDCDKFEKKLEEEVIQPLLSNSSRNTIMSEGLQRRSNAVQVVVQEILGEVRWRAMMEVDDVDTSRGVATEQLLWRSRGCATLAGLKEILGYTSTSPSGQRQHHSKILGSRCYIRSLPSCHKITSIKLPPPQG